MVARQRERQRRATSARWRPGRASATRRGRCTTSTTGRAATSTSTAACTRRTPRSTRSAAARRTARGPGARRPPPRAAVHPVRVRARDGQRPGRAVGVPGAVRAPPALPGRLRVGVDRPRAAPATPTARALRLRRRLRRAAARRQLRRRRPALPRPHAVARAARVQEGDRAGADRRATRAGCAIANLHDFRDLSHLAFAWALEEEGAPVAEGVARRRAAGRGRDRRGRAAGAARRPRGESVADGARRARRRRAVGARRPRGRVGPAAG